MTLRAVGRAKVRYRLHRRRRLMVAAGHERWAKVVLRSVAARAASFICMNSIRSSGYSGDRQPEIVDPYFTPAEGLRPAGRRPMPAGTRRRQRDPILQWNHPLGEVVTALVSAGLRIPSLREIDGDVLQQWPMMVRGEDRRQTGRSPGARRDVAAIADRGVEAMPNFPIVSRAEAARSPIAPTIPPGPCPSSRSGSREGMCSVDVRQSGGFLVSPIETIVETYSIPASPNACEIQISRAANPDVAMATRHFKWRRSPCRHPRIIHFRQIEPAGRRDRAAAAPVGRLQRRAQIRRAPFAEPDLDQRADHRAHLPVQERARADIDKRIPSPCAGRRRTGRACARGEFGLALRIAKGREIVPADQHARGLAHRLGVELALHMPDAAAIEGRRRAAIERCDRDSGAPSRRGARRNRRPPAPPRAPRSAARTRWALIASRSRQPIQARARSTWATWPRRVHARRRCGPRRGRSWASPSARESRLFQRLLDRGPVVLALPAGKVGAVIFERQLESRHPAVRSSARSCRHARSFPCARAPWRRRRAERSNR